MSTPRSTPTKSATSRANGTKSQGPKTTAGKAKSSQNSLRHGLTSRNVVLPHESQADFDQLLEAHLDQFMDPQRPATSLELDLIEAMAAASWRLRRLQNIETGLLADELDNYRPSTDWRKTTHDPGIRIARAFRQIATSSRALDVLHRYESTLTRTYDRAFKQLRALQQERSRSAAEPPRQPAQPPVPDPAIIETPHSQAHPPGLLPDSPCSVGSFRNPADAASASPHRPSPGQASGKPFSPGGAPVSGAAPR